MSRLAVHAGFWWLLGALILQRGAEMWAARRNVERLLAQGARLVRDDGYGLLVVTHTALLVAAAAEVWWAPWAGSGWWTFVGLSLLIVGEGLRGWSMWALGGRWTTRVVVLPATPLVARGPYRWLSHPIYVGVSLMIVGFPMAFGLWGTLLLAGSLNAIALARRIGREERALASVVANTSAPSARDDG